MTDQNCRIEPILSNACTNRDFVNRKEKLKDLTPVVSVPCDYKTGLLWAIFGLLVVVIFFCAVSDY